MELIVDIRFSRGYIELHSVLQKNWYSSIYTLPILLNLPTNLFDNAFHFLYEWDGHEQHR